MKKQSFCAILTTALAASVLLSSFAVPSFAIRKLGDVDGDGAISSADARIALRASVKLDPLTEEQAMAADIDGDTFVTSGDARAILRASVKLETLPDRYVGEKDTTEPERPSQPATPSDATPSDATPSDAETPEDPSDPGKPIEPATPSDATPSDAETPEQPDHPAFITPEKNNEFDILRSGTYYLIGKTVDESGSSNLEIAQTDNSTYLGTQLGSTQIAILTINDKSYLVNPAKNLYLDLNTAGMKAEMKLLGLDSTDFASNSFDFSFFPPLEKATRSETVPESKDYVKYVFEVKDGIINVTMCGKTLISLESARDGSVYRIDFTSVSSTVPSQKRELKNLKNAILQTVFASSLL